jgi:uncharacterized protein YdaT
LLARLLIAKAIEIDHEEVEEGDEEERLVNLAALKTEEVPEVSAVQDGQDEQGSALRAMGVAGGQVPEEPADDQAQEYVPIVGDWDIGSVAG